MHLERKSPAITLVLTSAILLLVFPAACTDQQSTTGVLRPSARGSDVIGGDMAFGARDYDLTSFDVSTLTLRSFAYLIMSMMRLCRRGSPHEWSTTASAHGAISSMIWLG